MSTSNPVLRNFDVPSHEDAMHDHRMTLSGTILRTILLLLILSATSGATSIWFTDLARAHHGHSAYLFIMRVFTITFVGGIALVIASILNKRMSRITAPFFSVTEGVALGIASAAFNMRYPGIAIQAIGLTVAMCICLLIAYGIGWIALKSSFRRKLSFAVCGAVAYCAGSILLVLVGVSRVPILVTGVRGALVSVAVIAVPGTALVATCDAAVQRAGERKPKYMEWYAALGIVVSLVWIYYEMLEMLTRTRRSA